jgi:hypothetical protein
MLDLIPHLLQLLEVTQHIEEENEGARGYAPNMIGGGGGGGGGGEGIGTKYSSISMTSWGQDKGTVIHPPHILEGFIHHIL